MRRWRRGTTRLIVTLVFVLATPVALKFINPAGVVVYHNTIIAENRTATRVSNAHFRNNLFLGADAATPVSVLGGPTAYSTYDYNGYRPNRGTAVQFLWLGPKPGVRVDYEIEPKQAPRFATLEELAAATAGNTRCRSRLRHLREPASAVPARFVEAREAVRRHRPELPVEGRRQGG